jgi:hypothetical protein
MRLRESYRVPLLLLGCFVTALIFPRACAETRVGVGALLPATAPLTAAETRDTEAALREESARLAHEVARLEEELAARPTAIDGSPANVRIVRPAGRTPVEITARVLHRDASATGRSFTIGVGRADGVREGLPVIWGRSLVGIVVTATEHAARVVRIDDPSAASALPARLVSASSPVAEARTSGIARGTGDRDAAVSVSLLRQGDGKPGDLAVTGVGNPLIPEGLVLGEVVRFGDDDRDGAYEADVRPLRDLDTLNSVLVLRVDGETGRAPAPGGRK